MLANLFDLWDRLVLKNRLKNYVNIDLCNVMFIPIYRANRAGRINIIFNVFILRLEYNRLKNPSHIIWAFGEAFVLHENQNFQIDKMEWTNEKKAQDRYFSWMDTQFKLNFAMWHTLSIRSTASTDLPLSKFSPFQFPGTFRYDRCCLLSEIKWTKEKITK